jgi:alpha-D-ribose 1-methylphosphonate 5-phosphate C-P lyase
MVGYSNSSPGYRVYNLATRCNTTYVHVKFQEHVSGFRQSHLVDSYIDVIFNAGDDMTIHAPPSCGGLNRVDFQDDDIPLHDVDKPSRLCGPLTILGTTWLTCPQFLG